MPRHAQGVRMYEKDSQFMYIKHLTVCPPVSCESTQLLTFESDKQFEYLIRMAREEISAPRAAKVPNEG